MLTSIRASIVIKIHSYHFVSYIFSDKQNDDCTIVIIIFLVFNDYLIHSDIDAVTEGQAATCILKSN